MLTGKQFTDAVARRLRAAQGIEVVRREGLAPLAPARRDVFARKLKRLLGQPLSPAMLRRLSYPTHVKLFWRYPPGDVDLPRGEGFGGEIYLYNLGLALTEKDFSHIDFGESPELKFLEAYRILDEHPSIGDGRLTLVRVNDEATDVELSYLVEWKPHRLRLTFEEYHWCQSVMLGYADWQLLFSDDLEPSLRKATKTTFRKRIASDLKKVWADADLGEFFDLADREG
jgi:hypothetical protein